jgi:hypothetical protein
VCLLDFLLRRVFTGYGAVVLFWGESDVRKWRARFVCLYLPPRMPTYPFKALRVFGSDNVLSAEMKVTYLQS